LLVVKLRSWVGTARVVLIVFVVGLVAGRFLSGPGDPEPGISVAPLVKSIQQLGQFHTVRFNMHDVIEHQRALEPKGLLGSVPGVGSLYKAATRNKVLVVAEGGVEAGVDLSQVNTESVTKVQTPEGPRYRIRLPRATVYTPEVKVQVVRRRPGLFWNNENIVPEATRAVEQRWVSAAQQGNIAQAAETNAVQMLSQMQLASGNTRVEYYF
jgi:hypothetical protein